MCCLGPLMAAVYSSLEESGSGALHHLEASCGRHSERYLQHLVMHTNRMILENSRLYACIDLLSSDSSHIPDEVVCHIFALSEEEFSKRYPSIAKHSFAENKSRASTDSTRRHLDFEEEQCGTPLLNSSQNQSADDFSTGLGTPKQWLETSPSKLQYENDRDAGSTCTPACILGEVAFQLERRIIQMVFGEESSNHSPRLVMDQDDPKSYTCQRHRFYGYTVSNMPEKIRAECRRQNSGPRDGVREADLKFKLRGIMAELRGLGYSMNKHSSMAQDVINKYGLFSQPPDDATIAKLGLHDFRCVRDHVLMLAEPEEREDLLVLLNCLHALGRKIGKPVLSFD